MDDDPRHVFGGEGDLLQLEEVHYFLLLVGWRRLEAHKLILPTLREKTRVHSGLTRNSSIGRLPSSCCISFLNFSGFA